jgi:hypothetical protein
MRKFDWRGLKVSGIGLVLWLGFGLYAEQVGGGKWVLLPAGLAFLVMVVGAIMHVRAMGRDDW